MFEDQFEETFRIKAPFNVFCMEIAEAYNRGEMSENKPEFPIPLKYFHESLSKLNEEFTDNELFEAINSAISLAMSDAMFELMKKGYVEVSADSEGEIYYSLTEAGQNHAQDL